MNMENETVHLRKDGFIKSKKYCTLEYIKKKNGAQANPH